MHNTLMDLFLATPDVDLTEVLEAIERGSHWGDMFDDAWSTKPKKNAIDIASTGIELGIPRSARIDVPRFFSLTMGHLTASPASIQIMINQVVTELTKAYNGDVNSAKNFLRSAKTVITSLQLDDSEVESLIQYASPTLASAYKEYINSKHSAENNLDFSSIMSQVIDKAFGKLGAVA